MLMSTSEKNAKDVIFGEINARITENPKGIFPSEFPSRPDITTELRFDKKVSIIPGNSSETFFTGYNIFAAVIDECDDHKKTEDKDYVDEGYTAIKRRVTSRFLGYGFIAMIGSPKTVTGFMEKKFKEASGDDKMYSVCMPTWEALDREELMGEYFEAIDPLGAKRIIPVEFRRDWLKNPEKFWRDLGAIPSYSVEPFITLTNKIDMCVNPLLATWDGLSEFPRVVGSYRKEYVAHIDLGINRETGDHCGIAVGRIVGQKEVEIYGTGTLKRPIVEISFVARLEAVPGEEIKISDVRRYLLALKESGFEYHSIQFDSWNSKDSMQILSGMGIKTEQVSVDKDAFAYEALKEAIYDDRIVWGDLWVKDRQSGAKIRILHQELKQLQRIKGNKIDHPVKGSKDVADAVAGVVIGLTGNTRLHKLDNSFAPAYIKDNLSIERLQNGQKQRIKGGFTSVGKSLPRVVW
jgi:hypothetical protein